MPDDVRLSKRLSLWLRHQPEAAGLTLDAQGWTDVDAVLAGFERAGSVVDWPDLLRLIDESDKQRFELSADASRIRARQGHSVTVDLDWPQTMPPALLYHGTVARVASDPCRRASANAAPSRASIPGHRHRHPRRQPARNGGDPGDPRRRHVGGRTQLLSHRKRRLADRSRAAVLSCSNRQLIVRR